MLEGFGQIAAQLAGFWRGLKPAQRVALASVVLVTLGAIALVVNVAERPQYTTLYANLAPEDASSIVDELRTRSVPFELTQAGTAIQVPVERVYDLRLELAGKGLPGSGPVGFEVFDQGGLAMTPFQQQMQYRRALEGELARTISRLGPVKWARVHINLPAKSAFAREKTDPTAAVVLGLQPGRTLGPSDANGIRQLIAGAVENLGAEKITIVDEKGHLLTRPGGDQADMLAAGALDVQRTVEKDLAERAQNLLEAALGNGRSVVTVSAVIDRKRFEEKQERVNPDESAVLSEQKTEEARTQGSPAAGGVPGTQSNLPGGLGAQSSSESGNETVTREVTNYDFSRSQSNTVVPMGEVQKLSVAVLVDGTYAAPPVAAPDATPAAPVYTPRTPQEIATYTDIVKRAVGFNEKRGDEIVVQNLQFRSPLEEVAPESPSFWENPALQMWLPGLSRFVLVLLSVVLLIALVIRPTLSQLAAVQTAVAQTPASQAQLPNPDAELAIPISKDQAKVVAEALRQWLRE